MNETTLNANKEEVVQPQYTGANKEEVTNPQTNVDEMSDEEFMSYLNSVQDGKGAADEQQPIAAEDTGVTEPAEVVEKNEPFKTFASQEEYQDEIDRIIGERLKKNRESINTLDGLKELARTFYGGDDSDTAIEQLIEDLQSQNAEKQGISVEDYKRQSQDSIDAKKYREELQKKNEHDERVQQIQRRWQSETDELKKIVPDFDFADSMKNKVFSDAIVSGMSVSNAYLVSAKQKAILEEQSKKQRKPMMQNGTMKNNGIGHVEANPATMSDEEFMKYINRLKG